MIAQNQIRRFLESNRLLTLFLTALATRLPAVAAGELGDPAAPLQIAEWVKGQPVDLAAVKGKQVVVVEFWATWCPPCRTSIPHLTELRKKFKDVIFIGVSDEDAATVKKFVAKMGDQMDYTVAVDKDKKTADGYMGAFGIGGIPHAFIVDKQGRIVWDGHPMADLDKALEEIVAGKHDLEKAKKRGLARKKLDEFQKAVAEGADAKVEKLGQELEALDAETGGIQPGQKFNAAQARKLIQFQVTVRQYQRALATEPPPAELAKLEGQLEALAPPDFNVAEFKERLAQTRLFGEYYRAATGRGETARMPELAKKLTEAKPRNAEDLNQWAWVLLTDERIKTRDLELATRLAKAAVDASAGKESAALDTYARALFDTGKVSDAVDWQKKAIAAAEDDELKKALQETLKQYEEKAKQQGR